LRAYACRVRADDDATSYTPDDAQPESLIFQRAADAFTRITATVPSSLKHTARLKLAGHFALFSRTKKLYVPYRFNAYLVPSPGKHNAVPFLPRHGTRQRAVIAELSNVPAHLKAARRLYQPVCHLVSACAGYLSAW
jgi:hypothetical protein